MDGELQRHRSLGSLGSDDVRPSADTGSPGAICRGIARWRCRGAGVLECRGAIRPKRDKEGLGMEPGSTEKWLAKEEKKTAGVGLRIPMTSAAR